MGEAAADSEKHLVLDELSERLDSLRVLRADSPDEAESMLATLGAAGKVEQDILSELSKIKPLWLPDRFEEAHRMFMRAMEVVDRNGSRNAKLPRLGPIQPIAAYLVQLFTRLIVRNYQQKVIDRVRHLYGRREANSVWGSDVHRMLRRARIDAERVAPALKGKALGLPTFLLGGAFISSIFSTIGQAASAAIKSTWGKTVIGVIAVALLASLSWVVLYAAATARRRIQLSLDQPLRALFETIGACGEIPRDDSRTFAILALVFTVLAIIVLPLLVIPFVL